ncbi:uncharacterized protein LOC125065462 isoform X2 [Vanessa atalanta]|uniref:uncharacterized protein LOC125065462 isoform X2 n=1 Tax=Vanessa atalanta TaxID=42275 RepID=UPI001FCDC3CD|nr:uncharacterized protein LOC125065462 isoform X2 [Vanessa atalanta]
MKFALLIVSIFLVSSSLGSPPDTDLLLEQRRDGNFVGNTKVLIEELINNLRSATQQAMDAVKTFSAGIQEQRKLFAEKLVNDLQRVRDRVHLAVKNVSDRFVNAGSEVRNCIDSHKSDLDSVFNNAVEKSKQCAGDRVMEIGNMIDELMEMSSNMRNYTRNSLTELKECTESEHGLLATGTCLSRIAIRTEFKGAVFLTQSGVLISRINLGFSTLPAALEVCAGTKLVEAGVNSAKIVMEIGSCSASSIFTSLSGNNSS